jgi:REP element-mobilizing transposase RayT
MSFTKPLYHIVYATKERRPFLTQSWRADMYDYLGGTVRGLKGTALEIGGVEDHVHLLTSIPSTISVSEFMSKLKANSSNWGKHRSGKPFGWQDGYSAFTVSESQTEGVRDYIRNQEAHQYKLTFAEELQLLLKKHNIPYDEGGV